MSTTQAVSAFTTLDQTEDESTNLRLLLQSNTLFAHISLSRTPPLSLHLSMLLQLDYKTLPFRQRRYNMDGFPKMSPKNNIALRKRILSKSTYGPPRGRSTNPSLIPVRKRGASHAGITSPPRQRNGSLSRFGGGVDKEDRSKDMIVGLTAYPTYLAVPDVFQHTSLQQHKPSTKSDKRPEFVRGSTCRLIMSLLSEYGDVGATAIQFPFECPPDDEQRFMFEKRDMEAVVRRCREVGLTALTPLESEDWGDEDIQPWWEDDHDGGMEEHWRDEPIVVDGAAGENGETGTWWKYREQKENRDWARWPSRSIGPKGRRELRDEDFG